jgi:hypothetical protein
MPFEDEPHIGMASYGDADDERDDFAVSDDESAPPTSLAARLSDPPQTSGTTLEERLSEAEVKDTTKEDPVLRLYDSKLSTIASETLSYWLSESTRCQGLIAATDTTWAMVERLGRLNMPPVTEAHLYTLALRYPGASALDLFYMATTGGWPIQVVFDEGDLRELRDKRGISQRTPDDERSYWLTDRDRCAGGRLTLCMPTDWPRLCNEYSQWVARLLGETQNVYALISEGYISSRLIQHYSNGRWFSVLQQGPSQDMLTTPDLRQYYGDEWLVGDIVDAAERAVLFGRSVDDQGIARWFWPPLNVWHRSGRTLTGGWRQDDERWFRERVLLIQSGLATGLTAREWHDKLRLGAGVRRQSHVVQDARMKAMESGIFKQTAKDMGWPMRLTRLTDVAQLSYVELPAHAGGAM